MTLEETVSEVEENKVETPEETPGDDIKQEESEIEISNKEQPESTENLNHVEVNMLQILDSIVTTEIKEEPVDTENTEVPENGAEKKENEEGVSEESAENAEGVEKDAPATDKENEFPGEIETVPFENIKIKMEPLDVDEELEELEKMFYFANVEVKEEPVDPESGTCSFGMHFRLL